MTDRSKFVGYVRTSTDQQSVSLDAQKRSIEAWALAGNHEIVSWCVEQASAKDTNRPELQHAMNLIREDMADGLVVTKVDRLSRSVIDFATLMSDFQKAEKALVCIADSIDMTTPSGRFVAGILAGLAQLERELIGQRTKDALAELKAQGKTLGRPPSEDVSPEIADEIREAYATTQTSHRQLAERHGVKISTVRRLVATS